MKLRLFYKTNNKVVYVIVINGSVYFFYDGFTSIEEAKSTVKEAYLIAEMEKRPNTSINITECIIDNMLDGTWSKIE